jgi:VIT1/CCC1 family predicted Fe2+/Mn2+ transporter
MLADKVLYRTLTTAQKGEITEYFIYKALSRSTRNPDNKDVLQRISADELRHHDFWKKFTGHTQKPYRIKVWMYCLVAKILGLTFAVKLMENGEGRAQINYRNIAAGIPAAMDIAAEEDRHEAELIGMINEERLKYVGSIILGLNDALIELSGALAGFTLALQSSRLVAMVGLITGIAAALSMGGTGYLSTKSEGGERAPVRSALYTGITYLFTVLLLTFPYLILANVLMALAFMICIAIVIIVAFNFYTSVAQDLPFWSRFSEMAVLSLGIAALSFGIGFAVKKLLGVEL